MLLVFLSTRSPRSTPCHWFRPPHRRRSHSSVVVMLHHPRTPSWLCAALNEALGSGGHRGSPPRTACAHVEELEDLKRDKLCGAPGQPYQLPRLMRVHDDLTRVPVQGGEAGDGVDWFTRLMSSRARSLKRQSCVGRSESCAWSHRG
jgi:hypothetical protein